MFSVWSSVLVCIYHSPSISCFTEPFLVFVTSFSLSLVFLCCLVVWFLIFCLVSWINLLPAVSDSVRTSPELLLTLLDYPPLSSPLDIVRRSKTTPVDLSTPLSCPQYTCLQMFEPGLLWPCLCLIKLCKWIRTPLVFSAPLHQYLLTKAQCSKQINKYIFIICIYNNILIIAFGFRTGSHVFIYF